MDGLIAYALAKKYAKEHGGLPDPSEYADGTVLVKVGNEWKAQSGYPYTSNVDHIILDDTVTLDEDGEAEIEKETPSSVLFNAKAINVTIDDVEYKDVHFWIYDTLNIGDDEKVSYPFYISCDINEIYVEMSGAGEHDIYINVILSEAFPLSSDYKVSKTYYAEYDSEQEQWHCDIPIEDIYKAYKSGYEVALVADSDDTGRQRFKVKSVSTRDDDTEIYYSFNLDYAFDSNRYALFYAKIYVTVNREDNTELWEGELYPIAYMAPEFDETDNGKVLGVVDGELAFIRNVEEWTFTLEDGTTVTKNVVVSG